MTRAWPSPPSRSGPAPSARFDGPALGYAQAGCYNAVVTNPFGEVISTKALLNVLGLAAWGDPLDLLEPGPRQELCEAKQDQVEKG